MSEKSYHDYVIKDGQFIGNFESMYNECDDPWMQSSQPNKYARIAGILHLKKFKIQSILECGCGLGYYADWIYKETGIIAKSVDVSETSILKAKELFPHLDFSVSDITKELNIYKELDCIMFSEIVWYILPDLNALFDVMKNNFKGKFLLVNQVFYKGTQKYGTKYFTNLAEFINFVPFELVGSCEATTISDSTIETSTIFKIG
jgi:SAM-dependent methyltransferase